VLFEKGVDLRAAEIVDSDLQGVCVRQRLRRGRQSAH
jgi:hypothetical protein